MRISTLLMIVLLSSCSSLWPFGKSVSSGNCLDDDSCENTNPLDDMFHNETWYCYGEDRETWSCDKEPDDSRIISISDATRTAPPQATEVDVAPQPEQVPEQTQAPAPEPDLASETGDNELFSIGDNGYAVQLIALETLDEVMAFAERYDIASPDWVKIRNRDADWYVVLLTVTENLTEAQQLADEWTEKHNPASSPWVRPVGPLKQAVRNATTGDG